MQGVLAHVDDGNMLVTGDNFDNGGDWEGFCDIFRPRGRRNETQRCGGRF